MPSTIDAAARTARAGRWAALQRYLRASAMTRSGLLTGFVLLHLAFLCCLAPLAITGDVEGDLGTYRDWAQNALAGRAPVLDGPWVYPAAALIPILAPMAAGAQYYIVVWLLLMTAANLAALHVLTEGFTRRSRYPAAWCYLLIVLLLAPVSMLRLEAAAAPLLLAGLVLLARRPALAGVLIAAATWIKVWPIGVAASAVIASSRRWMIAAGGLAFSGVIVAIVAAAGGLGDLFSFMSIQDDRALQIEAPIATPWVWGAAFNIPGYLVYNNYGLMTREVVGPGAKIAAAAVGLAMYLAFAGIVALLVVARRRLSAEQARRLDPVRGAQMELRLVLIGSFAIVTALIAFNKVGSPQYIEWLMPIVVAGLAFDRERWTRIARTLAWTSLLTTIVFPVLYMPLIEGQWPAVLALFARNALVVGMFVWGFTELWRCSTDPQRLLHYVPVPLYRPVGRRVGSIAGMG